MGAFISASSDIKSLSAVSAGAGRLSSLPAWSTHHNESEALRVDCAENSMLLRRPFASAEGDEAGVWIHQTAVFCHFGNMSRSTWVQSPQIVPQADSWNGD